MVRRILILTATALAASATPALAWYPTLTTTASGPVTLGGALGDTAHLSGGLTPKGTITFKLYGPNDSTCTTEVAKAVSATVSGNGNYPSPTITPTEPGTYRWTATYSGDSDNHPAGPTTCNAPSESATVGQSQPALTTTAGGPVTLGGALGDTAHLSGGLTPTGTITFKLYGPNDASCTTQVAAAVTTTVSGNGDYPSPTITPTEPGTYRWTAAYSGDSDNHPAGPTACNDPSESTGVTASPALSVVKEQRIAGTTDGFSGASLNVTVGQQIEYEMILSNTGDLPLALTASDPGCDASTLSGPFGALDAGGLLAPGGAVSYDCTHVIVPGDAPAFTNTVTASGTPPGAPVVGPLSSSVQAMVAGQGVASSGTTVPQSPTPSAPGGSTVSPGSACIAGSVAFRAYAGCARDPFQAQMSAGGVESVTFYLDGRRLRTLTPRSVRDGKYVVTVDPRRLTLGRHRLTAHITMNCGHVQLLRKLTFDHCRQRPLVIPRFTG